MTLDVDVCLGQLENAIRGERAQLMAHPVYRSIGDAETLKVFMEHHVFAVWDFMTVVKRLQFDLTSLHPNLWMPSPHPIATRFVNEIVLGEESDEVEPGVYMSHYELYLGAMREAEASTEQIESFMTQLQQGERPLTALGRVRISESIRTFVKHTLGSIQGKPHEVAACFVYGREDTIPDMFTRLLRTLDGDISENHIRDRIRSMTGQEQVVARHTKTLESSQPDERPYASLRLYLERHIALDGEEHGPMAKKLLTGLCGTDEQRWQEAEIAAKGAIAARMVLWDGIMAAIEQLSPSAVPTDSESPQLNLR
ncbi:MAG: hypothetical protein CL930_04040 [Deltaproteobacteria bacterium]|nr:hypothetical protein [Deltaproteobacteria bacterium]